MTAASALDSSGTVGAALYRSWHDGDKRMSGTVAGEPTRRLRALMRQLEVGPQPRGEMIRVSMDVPARDAACLLRAIMRVEAELLLHDADHVSDDASEPRTAAQRRADAFVELALRVASNGVT